MKKILIGLIMLISFNALSSTCFVRFDDNGILNEAGTRSLANFRKELKRNNWFVVDDTSTERLDADIHIWQTVNYMGSGLSGTSGAAAYTSAIDRLSNWNETHIKGKKSIFLSKKTINYALQVAKKKSSQKLLRKLSKYFKICNR